MGKFGIKNISEIIVAMGTFGVLLVKNLKDGLQGDDIKKIINNAQFQAELAAAIDDGKIAIDEVKDLDFFEGYRLAGIGYDQVQRVISELKG